MLPWIDDLRLAARSLARSPATTCVALVSLALGVGANLAVLTAARAVLGQVPQVREPDRLIWLFATEETPQMAGRLLPVSHANFEDFRDRAGVFSGLALGAYVGATLAEGDQPPEQLGGLVVSAEYFQVLGVEAALGRTFVPEEGIEERPVVVLGHSFWQRRFAGDPAVVGRTVRINRQPFTVIGVVPEGFRGTGVLFDLDFWAPIGIRKVLLTGIRDQLFDNRRALMFPVCVGRLARGVGFEQARAATATLAAALAAEHPADNDQRRAALLPLAEAVIPPERREGLERTAAALGFLAATLLILACVNVANLMLARLADRQAELGIRRALGAGRWPLARRLLAESMLLALGGGVLGLLVAWWGRGLLWALRPPMLDETAVDLRFDGRVLAMAVVLPLAAGLLAGLVPALRAAGRGGSAAALSQLAARGDAGRRTPRLARVLAAAQVAVALLALGAAALFLANFSAAESVDLGFRGERVATFGYDLGAEGYEPARGEQMFDRLVGSAAALPGVESVSLTSAMPFFAPPHRRTVLPDGGGGEEATERVGVVTVGLDYFETLGIPRLRGRTLERADVAGGTPVTVVNQALADRLWPGADPLRQTLTFGDLPEVRHQVVGVVATSKQEDLGEEPLPLAFLPRSQNYADFMTLLVRTAGDPEPRIEEIRRALQPLDPGVPITNPRPVSRLLDEALAPPRALARLSAIFAALALALAATGVGGMMLYSVRRRRQEIAVRMALGADRGRVVALVLRQAAILTAAGIAAGLALHLSLLRAFSEQLSNLLFEPGSVRWAGLAAAAGLLAGAALAASLAAAYRAASVDPLEVLRDP